MTKPHKHAEVIKAWADGAEIEYRQHGDSEWEKVDNPRWIDYYEYRVKPQQITLWLIFYHNLDVEVRYSKPETSPFNAIAIKEVTYTKGEGLDS